MSRTDTQALGAVVTNVHWERLLKGMQQRIVNWRASSGATHAQVAEATGRTVRTSMRWCSGEVEPDLRSLVAMSRLFGCRLSDLTGVP